MSRPGARPGLVTGDSNDSNAATETGTIDLLKIGFLRESVLIPLRSIFEASTGLLLLQFQFVFGSLTSFPVGIPILKIIQRNFEI